MDALPDPERLALFGVSLKGATRGAVREAMAVRGVRAIREKRAFLADIYDTRGVLEGTDRLEFLYRTPGILMVARYRFAGATAAGARRLEDLALRRYGYPTRFLDSDREGVLMVAWDRPDGMQVEIARCESSASMYLAFIDSGAWDMARDVGAAPGALLVPR